MRQMLHTKALVVKESVGATQAGVIDQVIGSTPVLDRMGDTITQEGWDLKDYEDNPVILWGHNMDGDRPPIAKALKVWIQGKGKTAKLMFTVQFDLADEFAADIYRKIKEGFINTVSVGFLPTEWEELEPGNFWGGLKYTAQQLLELSFVPVPANPEALVGMRSFAKKDKRFTPIDEAKLFPPIKNADEIGEIFGVTVDAEGKAEQIAVDTDQTLDEEGNVSGNTNDNNDGAYTTDTNVGEITALDMRKEMTAALTACTPDNMKGKADEANPTDPYHDLPGEGDETQLPENDMLVKDMTVAHTRGMMQDVFGDWMSNLSTTSNQDSDNVNDYSFDEGDTKAQRAEKIQGLLAVFEKSGRVLSGKNESKLRQAVDLLSSVLNELEKEEVQDDAAGGKEVETEETKGVVSYTDHGKSPEGDSWDASAELGKTTDPKVWKAMSSWFDADNAEVKSSYKLLHHKGDGDHASVWRGVAAAMATLLGARGGVSIPEADRKGVYTHLTEHYKEYDKEAPEFKAVEDQVLAGFSEEILALAFNQSEKHVVRLINKVLENQKEQQKIKLIPHQTVTPEIDAKALEIKVLSIFESALTKVSSINHREGGEK